MSIYQCDSCGCAENTALGWYHPRTSVRLNKPEEIGRKLCSACALTEYPSGESRKKFNGTWHCKFKRTFLPKGEFFTNEQGDLEHIKSGLIGDKVYKKYGREKEYD